LPVELRGGRGGRVSPPNANPPSRAPAMAFRRRPRQLFRHTDVPARVTESFILSGYRFPDCSFSECLASAFRPTNETGNFWTHFLALFVFAFHCLEPAGGGQARALSDPFFYPFWTYALGAAGLLAVSSLAHLFNAMSLQVREICFFVDYGTISAYTVGSSLAYFYYIHPRAGLAPAGARRGNASQAWPPAAGPSPPRLARGFFDTFYIPSTCLVALICTLACCSSRQRWRRHRYVIRTLVFLLPFAVASAPIFYRLYAGPPGGGGGGTLAPFFYRHCFWLVMSALINVSKIPERLSPGHFDIWGHSHQWFHCFTFLSILDELRMIKAEMRELSGAALLAGAAAGPTLLSTYGVMLVFIICFSQVLRTFLSQEQYIERA
uniref:Progestin and adipoQ receptor family member 9 n=1 Tax=Lepisosteus oculatus TaxID=7918 RepID=W5N763_LEPOC